MDENGKSDPHRVTFSYVTIAEWEIIQYNDAEVKILFEPNIK